MLKIYFTVDDEFSEADFIDKGCRGDVLVEIDGKFYNPDIITFDRLSLAVNYAFSRGDNCESQPCQILVKEAGKERIIRAVLECYNKKFFDSFIPISLENVFAGSVPEFANISNWIQVY